MRSTCRHGVALAQAFGHAPAFHHNAVHRTLTSYRAVAAPIQQSDGLRLELGRVPLPLKLFFDIQQTLYRRDNLPAGCPLFRSQLTSRAYASGASPVAVRVQPVPAASEPERATSAAGPLQPIFVPGPQATPPPNRYRYQFTYRCCHFPMICTASPRLERPYRHSLDRTAHSSCKSSGTLGSAHSSHHTRCL